MAKVNRYPVVLVSLVLIAAFVLAACGGAASNKPVDVQITLTDFKIESSLTTFTIGVAYHFVVTNNGSIPHELFIMDVPNKVLTRAEVAAWKADALNGIVGDDLTPGATRTMNYTFSKAAPQGTLEFACHLPDHYEAGMKLPIIVK